MKYLVAFCCFCSFSFQAVAQSSEESVKQTVQDFFKAFHAKDTVALADFAYGYVELQSIGKDKEGKVKLDSQPYRTFVKSIGSIPDHIKFEERLTDYIIKVDGDMANAWTPYEFYMNGEFSHCGVNSFQFIKIDTGWKIIYLVDTKRKEGCGE
ncbi:hypothetical protein SAMN05216480_103120 [Pustulibacterium marinum]|uniref:Lumazine-binding n=1 Tax=Pustulibacterium marinum TaxID=1224947 RepID=A0A1I7G385_9FLAO|nr:3-methyl-2-oxobutanoate hydroxymethyltransferase [Pustulibacterium marinum]SFU42899.1 hypothetical protein SAMN05216480_103120 [Pustulibacterium marinum]